MEEHSDTPLLLTRLIEPIRPYPTPLTVAVIIEPAAEPTLGETFSSVGVRLIPAAS